MIRVNENNCVGCEACVNVCPQNCIKMHQNNEGFFYPVVDEALCVNCSLCNKVCITENDVNNTRSFLNCYAAYSKDYELRIESSSGGLFSVFAKFVLSKGGTVYGATFYDDCTVHHIRANSIAELERLRGSKYMQSHIDNSYFLAKNDLDSGRLVLFTGTGCQIEGLKLYLQKDYDNLYTVDVDCYSVPSEKVWLDYIKTIGVNELPISFRDKSSGWINYSVKYNNHIRIHHNDYYMRLFLASLISRKTCYNCPSKGIKRNSDITLGDFWGINTIDKEMFDNKGTSIVIVHSEKGQKLFESISSEIVYKEERIDGALTFKKSLIESVPISDARKAFFEEFNNTENHNYKKLYNKYKLFYNKSIFEKAIITIKLVIKRIIRFK